MYSTNRLPKMDLRFILNDERSDSNRMKPSNSGIEENDMVMNDIDHNNSVKTHEMLADSDALANFKTQRQRDDFHAGVLEINTQHLSPSGPRKNLPLSAMRRSCYFEQLPTEIRLMIWQLALPCGRNGNQALSVKGYVQTDGTTRFAHNPWNGCQNYSFPGANMQEMRNLEMLRVCKESRGVYLQTFKHFFRGCQGQEKIRFSDDTRIHISNFDDFVEEFADFGFSDKGKGARIPQSFTEIRELGVGADVFSRPEDICWSSRVLSLFDRLKVVRLYVKNNPCEYLPCGPKRIYMQKAHYFDIKSVRIIKEALKEYKDQEHNIDDQIPEILLVDPNLHCHCQDMGPEICEKYRPSDPHPRVEAPPLNGNVKLPFTYADN